MTRSTDATGATLQEALVAALADLLGCDEGQVRVEVEAPGLEALRGTVRFDLEVAAEPAPDGDDEPVTSPAHEEDEATPEPAGDLAPAGEAGAEDEPDGDVAEALEGDEGLDEEAEAAADFLEGLLDALDLPGDLRIHLRDDHAEVEVIDIGSGALIGRRGQTLEAIQELVRCSLQRRFQRRARVKIDAEGYRARRLEKLLEKAEEAIEEVLDTGEPVRLEPMDVFERKAVHHLVAEVEGLVSRSQGREPGRRVIIERE